MYIDDVLRPVALAFLQQNHLIFHQDNAPAHTARLTTQYLAENAIQTLQWPSMSPDTFSIEHAWDELLGRRVNALVPKPRNVNQLREALIYEWNNIPQQIIESLVISMRRRCKACIIANGRFTI